MTGLTIQQTAEETRVSVHTLRYYERIGLISHVKRAPNGHRRYSEKDVNEIVFLTRLRATGMPISDVNRLVVPTLFSQVGTSNQRFGCSELLCKAIDTSQVPLLPK
jgi:DNA-binding transcriptional MerR regulator